MKKQFLLPTLLVFAIATQISAQSFKQQFNDLFKIKDTAGQRLLLAKWEKADINDAELYVSYYNYYVNKSRSEILTLGQNPKGNEVLEIRNQDSTVKEPVAYMYGDIQYEPEFLSLGFGWINKGIEKFPDRLDMRFGKIYMLGEIADYENFTKNIIKTIDYSAVNKNKWTWSDNKPKEDGKNFMLGSIQSYQNQIYNTENDSLLDNMKRIAQTVLKYYPDHVESLSNLSIVYILQKEYDKALDPLLKAEKIDPKDYIVLGNIAQVYKRKGDKKNAIKYYELCLKYGDEQSKKYAQEQIKELKEK